MMCMEHILCVEFLFQTLPIHIFRMGCKADNPLVHFQSFTVGWRLGQPPTAVLFATTLECVKVFQNAEVSKWQLLLIHIHQLSTITAGQRLASNKKSCVDPDQATGLKHFKGNKHSQLTHNCCFNAVRQQLIAENTAHIVCQPISPAIPSACK